MPATVIRDPNGAPDGGDFIHVEEMIEQWADKKIAAGQMIEAARADALLYARKRRRRN